MPRGKFDPKKLREGGSYNMEPTLSAKIEKMTEEADRQIEESRVNFRWGREQVSLIKKVAELIGVPYQTYIKQVLYRQAVDDLARFQQRKTDQVLMTRVLMRSQSGDLSANSLPLPVSPPSLTGLAEALQFPPPPDLLPDPQFAEDIHRKKT